MKARGMALPQTKLTPEDVEHIREIAQWKREQIMRANKVGSIHALAEKFGVHRRTIEKVLAHQTHNP